MLYFPEHVVTESCCSTDKLQGLYRTEGRFLLVTARAMMLPIQRDSKWIHTDECVPHPFTLAKQKINQMPIWMKVFVVGSATALRNSVLVLFWLRQLWYGSLKGVRGEERKGNGSTLFFYIPRKLFPSGKMHKLPRYFLTEALCSQHSLEASGCSEVDFVAFWVQLPWNSLEAGEQAWQFPGIFILVCLFFKEVFFVISRK